MKPHVDTFPISQRIGTGDFQSLRRPVLATIALSALLALATGCAPPPAGDESPAAAAGQPPAVPTAPQYESALLTLPAGDAAAGRQAFQDLHCSACHAVAGEATFEAPVADSQGPVLDSRLSVRTASEVAEAIVVPSHSISLRVSAELKTRLAGTTLSPMGDFSRAMTVRQLIDLVAYLRSIKTAA
ncbi:MAG: cytochrome c [Gemmatimonadetes bacterium]|nr:cytochrome c [Gemmatimonadota bacterium]